MAVAAAALVLGCGPTSSTGQGAELDAGEGPDARPSGPGELLDAAPVAACSRMDILVVVDNSGSMAAEQANLADNFPRFMDVLDGFDGLDYRIGITTTGRDYSWTTQSLLGPVPGSQTGGDNGALLERCDMSRRWVERGDPMARDTFSCAALVGDDGPFMEMPLGAIRDAFDARLDDGTNDGFLRDDALLAIVVLTDEDDCSYEQSETFGFGESRCRDKLPPVSDYRDFLEDLTGGPGRWALAVIAGPGPGSCSSTFGDATEAARLAEMVGLAGANGVFSSICDGDLSVALDEAVQTFDTACADFPPID